MTKDEINRWNMFIHLSPLTFFLLLMLQATGIVIPVSFVNILMPVIFWQIKKNEDELIDAHGKEVMNWQICCTLYSIILIVFNVFIEHSQFANPTLVLLAAYIGFSIFGAINAYRGMFFRYPYIFRLIK